MWLLAMRYTHIMSLMVPKKMPLAFSVTSDKSHVCEAFILCVVAAAALRLVQPRTQH